MTSARLLWPALGSGSLAALLLPGRPAGLGVALAGLAVIGVAVACTRPRDPWRLACWAAAAALAVVPAVRAAEWVVVLSLLAAVVLGSLAASGARTWRGVVAGALGWLGQLVPGLALLAVRAVPADGVRWGPAARGASLAAALLAVFAPLFVTADAAFAQIVGDAFDWDGGLVADRSAVFVLVAGLPLALALTARTWVRPAAPLRLLGRTEWLIALAALDALFAGFVALQLTTLFGGDRHVLDTAGLTYAEYAHQGFGQLMAAAALTLAVIALARRDSPALTLLLGLLCALTLVVLASALKRLELYEEAFGFTRLRLLAHAAILWLGALFVLVVAAGALKRTRRLPRATVAMSAAAALAFALANPDARIAEHNVKRFERTGEIDRAYLRHLSADAAPALIRAGEGHKPTPAPDGILSANLGRARARAATGSGR
jgi:hypothetical protein